MKRITQIKIEKIRTLLSNNPKMSNAQICVLLKDNLGFTSGVHSSTIASVRRELMIGKYKPDPRQLEMFKTAPVKSESDQKVKEILLDVGTADADSSEVVNAICNVIGDVAKNPSRYRVVVSAATLGAIVNALDTFGMCRKIIEDYSFPND